MDVLKKINFENDFQACQYVLRSNYTIEFDIKQIKDVAIFVTWQNRLNQSETQKVLDSFEKAKNE